MSRKEEFLAQYGDADHAAKGNLSNDDEIRYKANQNHLLPATHMQNIIRDNDDFVGHLGLSLNPSTPTSIIEKLSKHSDGEVERNAHIHRNATKEMVDDAINHKFVWRGTVENIIRHSPHITKEHLQFVLHSKSHQR